MRIVQPLKQTENFTLKKMSDFEQCTHVIH
jgi:hypothetical protein